VIDTRALVRRRPDWSVPLAFVVAVAPIAGAIAAAWIELSETGESPMWIVAGAFFVVTPGLGAAATERCAIPRGLRAAIALLLFVVLWAIWIANVPLPTRAGVWAPGGSRLSGAAMAGLTSIAWLASTSLAAAWVRRGSVALGFLIGAVVLAGLSATAFVVGSFTP
jgi:hypothetical protein